MLSKEEIRLVCINGAYGTGKTRIVVELARYLVIHNIFKNGVYNINFLKAQTLKDVDNVLRNVGFEKLFMDDDAATVK